jgi:hypothetical protein
LFPCVAECVEADLEFTSEGMEATPNSFPLNSGSTVSVTCKEGYTGETTIRTCTKGAFDLSPSNPTCLKCE